MTTVDNMQEIMQKTEETRQTKGYCPFQRTSKDGELYCRFLVRFLDNPHAYCSHLSRKEIIVEERDHAGGINIEKYFRSNFVPTKERP